MSMRHGLLAYVKTRGHAMSIKYSTLLTAAAIVAAAARHEPGIGD